MNTVKKSLLATAISLGVALPSLNLAQAGETKGPEFYGMFYLTLDYIDNDKTSDNFWRLQSRNSRLGVQQEFVLANGLTSFYKAEFGVKIDDATGFTQRDVYLGIKGEYGAVKAGRFKTPLRTTEGKIDLFDHLDSDIAAVLGGQVRLNNVVQYSTPKLGDSVVINAAFIPGENKDIDDDNRDENHLADAYSASAVYSSGNLYVAGGVDVNVAANKTHTDIQKDSGAHRVQLAVQYKIDDLTLGAIAQHAQDADNSKLKEDAFIVNAGYQIQATKLKLQYGLNQGYQSKTDLHLYALGADYSLDKSSFVTFDVSATETINSGKSKLDQAFTVGFNQKF